MEFLGELTISNWYGEGVTPLPFLKGASMESEVKELKKIFFVCLFMLLVTSTGLGCATLKHNYDYYAACMNDSGCVAQVEHDKAVARVVSSQAAQAVPGSENWPVLIISNVVSTLVGWWSATKRGKKLKGGANV